MYGIVFKMRLYISYISNYFKDQVRQIMGRTGRGRLFHTI